MAEMFLAAFEKCSDGTVINCHVLCKSPAACGGCPYKSPSKWQNMHSIGIIKHDDGSYVGKFKQTGEEHASISNHHSSAYLSVATETSAAIPIGDNATRVL